MSHTETCGPEHDDHESALAAPAARGRAVPSAVDPSTTTVKARAGRVGSFVRLPEVRWAVLSLVAFVSAIGAGALGAPSGVAILLLGLCYVAGGWEPALEGLRALRSGSLDVDLLMIVAALAAASIGQGFDGGLLIVIFATSGALEALATKRTEDSVRALLDVAPDRATRVRPDGGEELIRAAELVPHDVVVVRPGERIPADGRVVDGGSDVDQATITGEPLPISRGPGDEVFAGTMNGNGSMRIRVERAAGDTVVARIAGLVEEASATKARRQLFIETVEQRYSVAVVAATLALVGIPVALGAAFQPTLLRAMTFMIVASPCAVVLATMPPLLSAIANAGRHGVLVKSAVAMEQLADTTVVALDKTGTVTTGVPTITDLCPLGSWEHDDVLAMAAAVEVGSEHPLGRAIVTAARTRGLPIPAAEGFTAQRGRGVTATVADRTVTVGRPELLIAAGADHAGAAAVREIERAGRTTVIVSVDGQPAAVIGLADQPRADAHIAVAALSAMTGRSPVLLTGDNHHAARRLAHQVGIADVHADLLPEDKVARVRALAEHDHVCVVGDGVNDAPMLAAAATGIAMGRSGSDLALDTADVVLVRDDLAAVPALVDVSRRARRIVTQNLAFAGTVIVTLVTLDLAGHLPLPLGVAAHETSTVLVALNGLRLLSRRSWHSDWSRTEPATSQ